MNARPPTHAPPPKETLAGTVLRVTFHNADNGFYMLKVQERGKRDLVPMIGQRKAVGIAVRGGNMRPRWTKLRAWLRAEA